MMVAAAVAQVLAALVAVHSVSWSLRDEPASAVAFVPVSLTPLAAAPIWAPVETWAMFCAAGILASVALAPLVKSKLDERVGRPAPGGPRAVAELLAPVAIGETLLIIVYYAGLYTGGHDGGGAITHTVSAIAAAVLLATGSVFLVLK